MRAGWGIAPPFQLHETVEGGARIGRTGPPCPTTGETEQLGNIPTLLGNTSQKNEIEDTPDDKAGVLTQGESASTLIEPVKTSNSRN